MASSRSDWQGAYQAAVLALNTTARGCELRGLRWRDVNLLDCTITIRMSKTEAGERVIPLNATAKDALIALYHRSAKVGPIQPDHFVFFACEHGHIDRSKPQTGWRTAWRNLTRAIRCPERGKQQGPTEVCRAQECKADLRKVKSPVAGLRFHDLRHQAITELAESQTSDATIMAIAGHVSSKMLAHYSHVRLEAKRNALDALRKPALARGTVAVQQQANKAAEAGSFDTNRHKSDRGGSRASASD